jgi:hypothetical protein
MCLNLETIIGHECVKMESQKQQPALNTSGGACQGHCRELTTSAFFKENLLTKSQPESHKICSEHPGEFDGEHCILVRFLQNVIGESHPSLVQKPAEALLSVVLWQFYS